MLMRHFDAWFELVNDADDDDDLWESNRYEIYQLFIFFYFFFSIYLYRYSPFDSVGNLFSTIGSKIRQTSRAISINAAKAKHSQMNK